MTATGDFSQLFHLEPPSWIQMAFIGMGLLVALSGMGLLLTSSVEECGRHAILALFATFAAFGFLWLAACSPFAGEPHEVQAAGEYIETVAEVSDLTCTHRPGRSVKKLDLNRPPADGIYQCTFVHDGEVLAGELRVAGMQWTLGDGDA